MKKKLLSLVLAGAMVASTSVSAFAEVQTSQTPSTGEISQTPSTATGRQEVNVTNTEGEANIGIEGKIANGQNVLPPSTINVTVPTNASFTVDKNGKLIGSNINITSQGDGEVEVIAYKFNDITGTNNINVVDADTLASENRKTDDANRKMVALRLRGGEGAVSLKSETTNGSGICEVGTSNEINFSTAKVIGKVKTGQTLTLSLEGDAVVKGTALAEAMSDNFTLTLKLRKKA